MHDPNFGSLSSTISIQRSHFQLDLPCLLQSPFLATSRWNTRQTFFRTHLSSFVKQFLAVCCIFYVLLAQKTTIGEIFFPPLGTNFVSIFFCHVRQKHRVFRLALNFCRSVLRDIVRINLKTFFKSALAYPVREFIFLNFNHIGFTAVPTAVECHLFLGQLFQHKQQQLVVITTVRQVL